MFPCPLGGVVIDTPGMREIGAESADLSKTFAEIEELAQHCRFHDCTHTTGLGCAVLAAVESGESDSRRQPESCIVPTNWGSFKRSLDSPVYFMLK